MADSKKYDVFVSHSHKDNTWASEFVDTLKGEGVRAWFDPDIAPHEQWADQVEEALRESGVIVFLVTSDFATSPTTSFELGAAVGGNKKIVPIVTENIERYRIPSHLRRLGLLQESSPRAAGKAVAEVAKAKRRAG